MAHGVTNEQTEGGREGGKQQVGEELANPHHTVAYNVDNPRFILGTWIFVK